MKVTADAVTNEELHNENLQAVKDFEKWFMETSKAEALTRSEAAIIMTFLWWATRERDGKSEGA